MPGHGSVFVFRRMGEQRSCRAARSDALGASGFGGATLSNRLIEPKKCCPVGAKEGSDNQLHTGGPYQPLPKCPERTRIFWWPGRELNPRHADFQSAALPTELPGRIEPRIKQACGP